MKKMMMIVACSLFVFGVTGLSFAQGKAAPKQEVVEEVMAEDVVVTDKAGKPIAEEVVIEEVVAPVPALTTAATTAAADIK